MKKKDIKIIIFLIILLIVIIGGCWWYYNSIEVPKADLKEEKTTNSTNTTNEKQEENEIEEQNQVEVENVVQENETKPEGEPVIGQEEQSSEEGNVAKSNEEKAIEAAKKEWGTEDGVSFDIQNKEGNIYTIAVRSTSNTQVYAWYRVNSETGEIVE